MGAEHHRLTVPILGQAEGWVAIDKPAGRTVIPGRQAVGPPPLRDTVQEQLGRRVWVVHRLDRDTSGVLVLALNADAHRALCLAFEQGRVIKRYQALVAGRWAHGETIAAPLAPARRNRMRVAREDEAAKEAVTRVRPLTLWRAASLVEASPQTGRTHQIRVHMAHAGFPLLVDPQYHRPARIESEAVGGRAGAALNRTPLHARTLILPGAPKGPDIVLESPLPPDMAAFIAALNAGV